VSTIYDYVKAVAEERGVPYDDTQGNANWPLPWPEGGDPVAWANDILSNKDIHPGDGRFRAAMHLVGLLESVRKVEIAKDEILRLEAENQKLRQVVEDVVAHLDGYDLRDLVLGVLLK
jgi:hypothetical protein